jgi:hypothetical protein
MLNTLIVLNLLNGNPITPEIKDISDKILLISPNTSEPRARFLAKTIDKEARSAEIDPDILVVILRQESNFKNAAINSYIIYKEKACFAHSDLGISQVSEDWVDRWFLDREKLINDDVYNIHVGVRVLKGIKKEFGEESQWWTRYNSSSEKPRAIYANFLNGFFDKLYQDELLVNIAER